MTRSDTTYPKPGFTIKAQAEDVLDLVIYGSIGNTWYGDVNADAVVKELSKRKKATLINVYINSPGGDVFAGHAIYNALCRHKARVVVTIDGYAASIASVIAMAGDEIFIAQNAMMMIHDPYAWVAGDAAELRRQAELMDKIKDTIVGVYAARSSLSAEDAAELMSLETWFTATEALDAGLADTVIAAKKIAACGDLSFFKNKPANLVQDSSTFKESDMSGKHDATTTAQNAGENKGDAGKAPPPAEPVAAGLKELKKAFPEASSDFLVKCQDEELTLSEAKDAWSAKLAADLKVSNAELSKLKETSAAGGGVKALGVKAPADKAGGAAEDDSAAGDVEERWTSLVQAKVKGGMAKHKAISAVVAENPGLQEEYLNAYNTRHGHPGISG